MSGAGTAWRRLEAAVARLEAAAQGAGTDAAARDGAGFSREEVEALRAERERLGRALAEARADRDELEKVTDRVAGRLDLAIGQLKSILER